VQVLWVSHVVPYPPKSGQLIRAYSLLKAVAERHTVDLVAFTHEPIMRALFKDPQQGSAESRRELGRLCRVTEFLPIDRLTRPFGRARTAVEALLGGDGYTADRLRSPAAARVIGERAARNNYAVAHFDTIGLASYRASVAAVPATLDHHNVESHMMRRRADNESNLVRKVYFRQEASRLAAYEKKSVPSFAVNIVCSELDARRLRAVVPEACIEVIPNGVDCGYFRSAGLTQRPNSLIFVASLDWYPNAAAALYLLREIWPRVLQLRPQATLDIVGANASAEILRTARGAPGVAMHGFLPDVRPLIDSAALYVCPIRDGGGTKLKVLDASAMQKCIVAHPVACEGINLQPGISVQLADAPDEFARSIVSLLDRPETRAAMGRAARQLAESEYSSATIGHRFVTLLERIAVQGDSRPASAGCRL
jgi:glycosyltransferase involved in cell wall biosynthesis